MSGLSLLRLPQAVLSHILSFSEEQKSSLCNAMLACKTLQQAGEAAPRKVPLMLTAAKLQQARDTGQEGQLLAFLSRKAAVAGGHGGG